MVRPLRRSDHDMQVYDVTQINRHRKQSNLVAVIAMIINSYQMAECEDPGQSAYRRVNYRVQSKLTQKEFM